MFLAGLVLGFWIGVAVSMWDKEEGSVVGENGQFEWQRRDDMLRRRKQPHWRRDGGG